MTHELFLDIEPTSVKCVPTTLQSVGCKQCEDDVSGASNNGVKHSDMNQVNSN